MVALTVPAANGGSPPGCGSVLSFIIDGFGGFNSGAFTFNNVVSQIVLCFRHKQCSWWGDWCGWCHLSRRTCNSYPSPLPLLCSRRAWRHRHARRVTKKRRGRRSRSELTREIRSPSRQMATVASPVPLARGSVVSAVPLPPATFTSTKLDTARSKTDRATLAKDQPRSAGSCSCWAVHF